MTIKNEIKSNSVPVYQITTVPSRKVKKSKDEVEIVRS